MTGLSSSVLGERRQNAEKPAAIAEYPGSIKDRLPDEKEAKNAPNNDAVQRMVGAKRAEGERTGAMRSGRLCTTSNRCRLPSCSSTSSTAFLPGRGWTLPFHSQRRRRVRTLPGLKRLEAAIREKRGTRNLFGYIGAARP